MAFTVPRSPTPARATMPSGGEALKFDTAGAHIPTDKLRDYLLSPEHPDGRAKAAYLARLGYTQETWQRLEADLRRQHLTLDAASTRPSP